MKKLALFFPGIGYTVDKPLMHYCRKLASDAGYEIKLLPYTGFPHKVMGDMEKMRESCLIALAQTREMLSDVDLAACDDLLLVGKSIGTVAAAETASRCQLTEHIRFILYTPLEETFSFPLGKGIVFTGSADPWVREGRIPELCRQRNMPCHVISGANHSLETGFVTEDLENLKKIMKKTEKFIRDL